MSTKNVVQFDQSKCVDQKWAHQNISTHSSVGQFSLILPFSVLLHNLSDPTGSRRCAEDTGRPTNDHTEIRFECNVHRRRVARRCFSSSSFDDRSFASQGKKVVRVNQRSRPIITDESDAIIHVTSSTICGSDLHMCKTFCRRNVNYFRICGDHLDNGDMKGMKAKDTIGHECK